MRGLIVLLFISTSLLSTAQVLTIFDTTNCPISPTVKVKTICHGTTVYFYHYNAISFSENGIVYAFKNNQWTIDTLRYNGYQYGITDMIVGKDSELYLVTYGVIYKRVNDTWVIGCETSNLFSNIDPVKVIIDKNSNYWFLPHILDLTLYRYADTTLTTINLPSPTYYTSEQNKG